LTAAGNSSLVLLEQEVDLRPERGRTAITKEDASRGSPRAASSNTAWETYRSNADRRAVHHSRVACWCPAMMASESAEVPSGRWGTIRR